ncbi:hypothetical protein AOQ84DRAFT_226503 [Glonium stellatum]|uniref:Uncharacterized protein n=1 Tax=Glonium stellatum TaxID=574774 RepID=A0A8E2ESX4_9PEZI|nr:hypothetical protein AOQ84DRAFT_226503 [Glonium stellatum]
MGFATIVRQGMSQTLHICPGQRDLCYLALEESVVILTWIKESSKGPKAECSRAKNVGVVSFRWSVVSFRGSVVSFRGSTLRNSGLGLGLWTETGAYNLRWAVRALWAGAVICFLVLLYLTIQRNRELYLFITLILAGHFVALFAQTTTSAIEGIVTFGPLALPTCAGLVYLPFRTQILNASSPDTEMNPIPSEDRQVTDDEVVVAEPAVLHPPEPPGRENGSDDIVNMLVTGVMGSVVQ